MLAGLIRDDERGSLDGIPGLSDLPLVGRLFAHTTKTIDQTDIILTLTPHIIRVLDLNEADLRPFRVGRDSASPITELPLPLPVDAARAEPVDSREAESPPVKKPRRPVRRDHDIRATLAPERPASRSTSRP